VIGTTLETSAESRSTEKANLCRVWCERGDFIESVFRPEWVSYYKLGTSMEDNTHLFLRPPKDDGGFYTVEDAARNVLAHGRTVEDIAVEWHKIDDQKVIVEKLVRQSSGSSHRLLNLI